VSVFNLTGTHGIIKVFEFSHVHNVEVIMPGFVRKVTSSLPVVLYIWETCSTVMSEVTASNSDVIC